MKIVFEKVTSPFLRSSCTILLKFSVWREMFFFWRRNVKIKVDRKNKTISQFFILFLTKPFYLDKIFLDYKKYYFFVQIHDILKENEKSKPQKIKRYYNKFALENVKNSYSRKIAKFFSVTSILWPNAIESSNFVSLYLALTVLFGKNCCFV